MSEMSRSAFRFRVALACLMAVLLAIGFAQPASAALAAGVMEAQSVTYLPDVSEEMMNPSYWSDKQQDPTEQLADRSTIDQLNQAGIDADGTMLQPLKETDGAYYDAAAQRVTKDGAAAELASAFLGQAYDEDWSLIDQADVDEILANYPTDGVEPSLASPYGIVTTHTTMRAYPTDRMLMYTYGDYDDDNLYLSALRVNEPVIVRAVSVDGNFFLCVSSCLSLSWVPARDVAICKDHDEWLSAWDIPQGQELVVTGYKVRTEQTRVTPNTANRMLYMGTVLERVDWEDPSQLIGTRSTYNNHVCYLPVRNDDGTYSKELALIAESEDVAEGFLPLTKENIAQVAFGSLGEMYGWGGMLEANDCSGYVRDVYKCFGLELARNTTWQMRLPVRKYDLSQLDEAHKAAAIAQMPLGTVLFWGGHEMIYLGQDNGKLYVISATGSIGNLFSEEPGSAQVKAVIVNTLDMIRGNRNTWLSTLTTANIPYIPADDGAPSVYDIAFYENGTTWPDASYAYTGEAIEPNVEIPGLTAGTDYEVTFSDNVEVGTASVTVAGKGDYAGSMSGEFQIVPKEAPASSVEMYRMYNENSGEHFYTASIDEREDLVSAGWSYEGIGWYAPELTAIPVYRLYNSFAGDHHYTVDASELSSLVEAGWTYEGIGWYSDEDSRAPLYRLYNPNAFSGAHHYTADAAESDWLAEQGWIPEGIGWYGVAA